MTRYVVLRQTGDHTWVVENNVQATSPEAAIKLALANVESASGTYVATPFRSWKPVTVQAVQTTTIKLGEAT